MAPWFSRAGNIGMWTAGRLGKILLGVLILLAVLVAAGVVISFFVDEPMRRTTEREMNKHLKGYHVRIEKVDFNLFGLAVDVEGWTIYQDAHPRPPVAYIPRMHASVHWKELLSFKKERKKTLPQKLWAGIVAAAAKLLQNPPHKQVATETDISGTLKNPDADILEIVTGLLRNAFFQAILPGFRAEAGLRVSP